MGPANGSRPLGGHRQRPRLQHRPGRRFDHRTATTEERGRRPAAGLGWLRGRARRTASTHCPSRASPSSSRPSRRTTRRTRFNDGEIDPQGRFWAGTMGWHAEPGLGSLYRLDPDGTVTRMVEHVTISNGLGWSPDGGTMYYVDTPTLRIDRFDFDPVSGEHQRPARVRDHPRRRRAARWPHGRCRGRRLGGHLARLRRASLPARRDARRRHPPAGLQRLELRARRPGPARPLHHDRLGGVCPRRSMPPSHWRAASSMPASEVPGLPRVPFAG